jgi:hypothetical protein
MKKLDALFHGKQSVDEYLSRDEFITKNTKTPPVCSKRDFFTTRNF